MRAKLTAYTNARGRTDYEKVLCRVIYDVGCELERIADAVEEDEEGSA